MDIMEHLGTRRLGHSMVSQPDEPTDSKQNLVLLGWFRFPRISYINILISSITYFVYYFVLFPSHTPRVLWVLDSYTTISTHYETRCPLHPSQAERSQTQAAVTEDGLSYAELFASRLWPTEMLDDVRVCNVWIGIL